jgi:RecA-family ATPase
MSENQDAVLSLSMWSRETAEQVFDTLTVTDFEPGNHAALADLIQNALYQEQPDIYVYCQVEAAKTGRPDPNWVGRIYGHRFTAPWKYYAELILEESNRRNLTTALTSALNSVKEHQSSPETVLEDLTSTLGSLATPVSSEDDTLTLRDIMETQEDDDRWAFPHLLKENERLMITGNEGGGKSAFVYQMMTGAAFGYDTLHLEPTEPKRVMFIDVENNELQTKRNVQGIVPTLRSERPDVEPEWRWFRQRVINLLDPRERNNLIARVRHYAPEILYVGTVYKLTDTDDNVHQQATAIRNFGDKVRSHVKCAMVVEHHSGHGFNNDRNSGRPEGSSQFMRWPDAGYSLSRIKTDSPHQRLVRVKPWRGDRFTGREWPVALRSGGLFPWTPIMSDEWEARWEARYG